jgi:hypothetical protein
MKLRIHGDSLRLRLNRSDRRAIPNLRRLRCFGAI